jgi:hypothetical protein
VGFGCNGPSGQIENPQAVRDKGLAVRLLVVSVSHQKHGALKSHEENNENFNFVTGDSGDWPAPLLGVQL